MIQEIAMKLALCAAGALLATAAVVQPATAAPVASAPADGVVRQRSAHGFDDTVRLLKADIAAKGIRFFDAIDQSDLGAAADLSIRRSTLLLFGNPPLGVQFLQSNPLAGLDWPVRMLVVEDQDASVWVAWTDFEFIGRRYRLADRGAQLAMARDVAASIAASAAAKP
jgi:uncharacterized protein (DUF302 family)